MNRIVKYSLQTLKWAVIVVAVLYFAVWLYVYVSKNDLISRIKSKVAERTHGEVIIKDLSVSIFRTFPFISLEMSDVSIRDTLYHQHQKEFFKARRLYARINPLAALSSAPWVSKVVVRDGGIHILTDSTGYTNKYILKADASKKKAEPVYPGLLFRNFHFIMENPERNKSYHFSMDEVECTISGKNKNIMKIAVDADMIVKSLAFNTDKGSYLENKLFVGKFDLRYDKASKILSFKDITIKLDNHPYVFTGNFNMDTTSRAFDLQIRTDNISFNKAAGLLPFTISKKLVVYQMEKPVSLRVTIAGTTKFQAKPKVLLVMNTQNNTLSTPMGKFINASFNSSFTNSMVEGQLNVDENSAVTLENFSAVFEDIPLKSKMIRVSNLKQPFIDFDIQSDFQLTALNDLTGTNSLRFDKGTSSLNIKFKGPVTGSDTINSSMDGAFVIRDASMTYIPRGVHMTNCNGTIRFAKNDVFVEKLNTVVGNTKLLMNGVAKNVLSKLDSIPEQMSLSWHVYSPEMQLSDFQSFLKRPSASAAKKQKAKFARTGGMIDKLFTEGDIAVNIETPKMIYKKFIATNVNADILLSTYKMALRNIALAHAGGTLQFNGTVSNGENSNTVAINTNLNKINISELLSAFNDFGQDAVTHKNLKGLLTANVQLNTVINDKAEVIQDNTKGVVNFLLENGQLINFEPVQKIGTTAFKKQNFSDIKFADLKNTLEIDGSAFIINKMEIRSSAITLFIQGVYDSKKGTDMSIQVPVRNLLKDQSETDLSSEGHKGGGISLRLRAKTGGDGKLKVGWDPFRKSIKNKKEASDTLSTGKVDG